MIAAGTGAEWPSVTAKQHARQLLYYVADHAPHGLKPETLLLHGHAAEQISRRAAGVVDLLFAGSRGHGPLRRAMADSVSGALVHDAGCPVVITPRTGVAARVADKANA
jgi:nucleotide-binding universal stress UspA family protein